MHYLYDRDKNNNISVVQLDVDDAVVVYDNVGSISKGRGATIEGRRIRNVLR